MTGRLKDFFENRLKHVATLWAGIWFASFAIPIGIAWLGHKDPNKAVAIDLEPFMDWRLLGALLAGWACAAVLIAFVDAVRRLGDADHGRAREMLRKCADEVSAAATHLACGAAVAAFVTPHSGWTSWLAAVGGLALAALLFNEGTAHPDE